MNNIKQNFEVIIPIIKEDLSLFAASYPFIMDMLSPQRIILIGSLEVKKSMPDCEGIEFLYEDSVYENMNIDAIKTLMKELTGNTNRSGWYYQQFLKMAYSFKSSNPYYVVWDADTIPLNKIDFIDENTGQYCLTMKSEYHKPYFETLYKLFDGEVEKGINKSFIAENMVFDKKIMIEIINNISCNSNLPGNTFYEKILRSVAITDLQKSGFSEFETYGNYAVKYYSNKFKLRELRTLREGIKYLGIAPDLKILKWAAKDYDIISIEKADNESVFSFFSKRPLRNFYHLKSVVSLRNKIRRVYRNVFRKHNDYIEFD